MPSEMYTDAYFEALAAWHRASYPTFETFLREAVGSERPATALDLGCGEGVYGPILAQLADAVDACDGAPPALEKAAQRNVYRNITRIDLAAERWDGSKGPYDLVFCTEVIEHLPDERSFCRNLAARLNPGGLVVLTTTTYHLYLFYYLCFASPLRLRALGDFLLGCLGRRRSADRFVRTLWDLTGGHEHGFGSRRLASALRQAGLRIETRRYANVQPVFPLDGLDQPRFRGRGRRRVAALLRPLARAINAVCTRTAVYGPNIMVAARRG